jgi:hypothetical protein
MRRTTSTSIIKPGRQGKEQPVFSTEQNKPQRTVHIPTCALTHRTVAAMMMMMITITTMKTTKTTTTVTKLVM